jgi:hypothetical protein
MKRPPDRKRLAAALVFALAAACLLPRPAPGAADAPGAPGLLGAAPAKGG